MQSATVICRSFFDFAVPPPNFWIRFLDPIFGSDMEAPAPLLRRRRDRPVGRR
jgi:hypothetical protein